MTNALYLEYMAAECLSASFHSSRELSLYVGMTNAEACRRGNTQSIAICLYIEQSNR